MALKENVLSHKSVRVSLVVTLIFNVCYLLWLIFQPGNSDLSSNCDNIIQLLGYLLGASFCLLGFANNQGGKTKQTLTRLPVVLRLIPLLFGLGMYCQALGQAFYIYYDLAHLNLFPSWADAGFLGGYIPLILAILLLPTQRHSGIARSRILLDALVVIVAIITFSWYFVLGPTLLQLSANLLTKLVATGYPFFDLIMILCLILLTFRSMQPALQSPLRLLIVAFSINTIGDTIYTYQTLHNTYTPGSLTNISWPVGCMLLGMAVQWMYLVWSKPQQEPSVSTSEQIPVQKKTNRFQPQGVHLPYILIPAVFLLASFTWISAGNGPLTQGVYLGSVLLVALILIRQIVVMREVHTLNQQLHHANTQLELLATTDPLTGLPNHRALVGILDQELERSQRYEQMVSLLFLDIDHFKALNDSYGHPIGDAVLHTFATLTRSVLRQSDVIGRWGGEEFVAILPYTDSQAALETAERIRTAVAAHIFSKSGLRITCSVGIATTPTMAHDRDRLIMLADQAMYAAKHLGRNQVRLASEKVVLALQNVAEKASSREETALTGIVDALGDLIEAHDHATGQHTQRVSTLATRLALELGMTTTEAAMIGIAGRLHDLGKVAIPDAILHKPSSLTAEEWAIMQTHTVIGGEVVSQIPALRGLAATIRAHHERWDGMGYPDQLAQEEVPLGARIISVVDAYEAMTTDRPYQKARDPQQALAELQRSANTQFDPQIVQAVVQMLAAETPAGILVEV